MNKMCRACLQIRESTTPINYILGQQYSALTRLQVTDATQVPLCHYCKWSLKKSYAFAEKCRLARMVLKQWEERDCSSINDLGGLKQQDVYKQNERLFTAELGNSETFSSEYLDGDEAKSKGTVTFVKVEDLLRAETCEDLAASSRDENRDDTEGDKLEDALPEAKSTEFIALNVVPVYNEIYFEQKKLTDELEGESINELESDIDIDMANENKVVAASAIGSDETKGTSSKTRKKNVNENNVGFELLRLSREKQREELKSRRRDPKYLNSRFRCHNCALGFVYEDSYKVHTSRHEESNGKYQCEVCMLRFATRSGFCMHRAVHRQRFRCRLCLEVVKKCRYHRARCRAKMAADTSVKCSVCDKEFGDSARMERHVRRQHADTKREQTFQCQQCDKTFSYIHTLRSHLLLHETTSEHSCRVCDRHFVTHRQLADHERSHAAPTGSCYCASCDVTLKNAKSLRSHFTRSARHAQPEQYTHSCVSCDASYTNARDLRAHSERNHATDATYSCAACNVTYACGKTLGDHVRRVHGARDANRSFVCEFCGKAFKARSTLQKHVELHASERMEISKRQLTELNAQKKAPSRMSYTNVSIKE